MASVNFLKCKGAGAAKAVMRHSEKEERLRHEHANADIDKSLTENNSSLYGLSYEEMCEKYSSRIIELDATTNTNKRADRVTMFSLEFTVPEGLPTYLEEAYLSDCEKIIAEQYGERNIVESTRHLDEKHKYVEKGEEKISRAHAHVFVVPEIDGKLNGKQFSSKAQMMKLNKSINEMSLEKYKIPFMTGKLARHQTVEQLKNDSKIEKQKITIQKNCEILERQVERSQSLKAEKEELKKELASAKEDFENEKIALEQRYHEEQARISADYAEKRKSIAEKEKALEGRALSLEELKTLESKRIWSAEEKENILKTASLSAQRAERARSMKAEKDEAVKARATLEAENRRLKDAYLPNLDRDLKLATLENKVEKLERKIELQDKLIKQHGLEQELKKITMQKNISLHSNFDIR